MDATVFCVREGREFDSLARIGAARARIANTGGEEFKKAEGGAFTVGGAESRGAVFGDGDKLVHVVALFASSASVTN
jgi:hypothetical protein